MATTWSLQQVTTESRKAEEEGEVMRHFFLGVENKSDFSVSTGWRKICVILPVNSRRVSVGFSSSFSFYQWPLGLKAIDQHSDLMAH